MLLVPPSMPPHAPPVVDLRRHRRIPAVTTTEPRGAMRPGRDVVDETHCNWEEPLGINLSALLKSFKQTKEIEELNN
ncbi:hypothetical protein M5689_024216 [Euphorbia peplus]|nr:hypothetical protein M5689_024216 [Euphorbia peplus]